MQELSGHLQVMLDQAYHTCFVDMQGNKVQCWKAKKDRVDGKHPLTELDMTGAVLQNGSDAFSWTVRSSNGNFISFKAADEAARRGWMDSMRHYPADGEAAPPMISLRDFVKVFRLGSGSYSNVYAVRKKDTKQLYAMKTLNKSEMSAPNIRSSFEEKKILEKIDHPFIVKLHYAFQTQHHLYLILDLLAGGELFYYFNREEPKVIFNEENTTFYGAEVACAIDHLHSRDIIFRDLKAENVVLDRDGHACITDFGLAKMNVSQQKAETYCGTSEYLAPEVLMGHQQTKALDWWCLGSLMYEMLFNQLPFYSPIETVMYERILTQDLPREDLDTVSPDVADLLQRLLTKDPVKRMQSLEEFRAHPALRSIDFEKLLKRELAPPFTPDPDPRRNFESVGDPEAPLSPLSTDDEEGGDVFAGFTYNKSSS